MTSVCWKEDAFGLERAGERWGTLKPFTGMGRAPKRAWSLVEISMRVGGAGLQSATIICTEVLCLFGSNHSRKLLSQESQEYIIFASPHDPRWQSKSHPIHIVPTTRDQTKATNHQHPTTEKQVGMFRCNPLRVGFVKWAGGVSACFGFVLIPSAEFARSLRL